MLDCRQQPLRVWGLFHAYLKVCVTGASLALIREYLVDGLDHVLGPFDVGCQSRPISG
jgi:hypothetical protein